MLTMFEPKTLPTEIAALPETAAIIATVSSGSEVEKAIRLKPTAVFPSLVMLETLTALLITKLLAQFRTRKETAMIAMSISTPIRPFCTTKCRLPSQRRISTTAEAAAEAQRVRVHDDRRCPETHPQQHVRRLPPSASLRAGEDGRAWGRA